MDFGNSFSRVMADGGFDAAVGTPVREDTRIPAKADRLLGEELPLRSKELMLAGDFAGAEAALGRFWAGAGEHPPTEGAGREAVEKRGFPCSRDVSRPTGFEC